MSGIPKILSSVGAGVAVAFLASVGVYTVIAFYKQPRVVVISTSAHEASEPLPDFSVSSIGDLAGVAFESIIDSHLLNLTEYRRFQVEIVSADNRKMAANRLAEAINLQHTQWAEDPLLAKTLAEQIIFRVMKGSGLPRDQYRQLLGIDHFTAPLQLLDQGYTQDVFEDSLRIITDPSDLKQIDQAMSDVDRLSLGNLGLKRRLIGLIVAPEAVRVMSKTMDRSSPMPDLLSDQLSEEEQKFFCGSLAQGQLVFTSRVDEEKSDKSEEVLRVEVALIVADEGFDRYPMSFRFELNQHTRQWNLIHAFRCSSPRVAASIPFAF